ncbi:manganese transport regulator MntR [compost metagenome]|uniref:GntR family transcriptional regulator n=1 Tax=Pseudomonas putida TaxID=303 RepID=A0A1L5PP62_PSEPU|nr:MULTISPECIES: GntR family transcriptional regulator [Pseudomonas]APO81970.1 GntR family transcriptional regulator [Pseudomonas putida]WJD72429.1 GntR family transcriptional regulator [Pseudomonas asiatica]
MTSKIKTDLAGQLAPKILDMARARSMRAGDPLREEAFAKELGVSRSPVRRGFALLEDLGLAVKEPNRGYFLTRDARDIDVRKLPLDVDTFEDFYLRVVDDVLAGEISTSFFEAELLRKYDVPRGQLLKVLNRLANEGMIERNPGQGWSINSFLHDSEAHIQSYRFRMAIEPAALLEPTYKVDSAAFAKARRIQQELLDGDIFTLSRSQLFQIGSQLHELIVRCSGNTFFLEAIRRQNQLRRFMAYQSNVDRPRLISQCKEHIQLLDLIEQGRREEAAAFLRQHLDVVSRLKAAREAQEARDLKQALAVADLG